MDRLPRCRPIGFACLSRKRPRGTPSLATPHATPSHHPPRRRATLQDSAVFRGRANVGSKRYKITKRKAKSNSFSPSVRTNAGCSIREPPLDPCGPSSCEAPSGSLRVPPCEPPRPQKMPKHGDDCNLHRINAPSTSLAANSTAKRAREATGGDGRTPKIQKDLRATKDLRAPEHIKGSACIRGSGLCPLTGWTIADYCPSCHG